MGSKCHFALSIPLKIEIIALFYIGFLCASMRTLLRKIPPKLAFSSKCVDIYLKKGYFVSKSYLEVE